MTIQLSAPPPDDDVYVTSLPLEGVRNIQWTFRWMGRTKSWYATAVDRFAEDGAPVLCRSRRVSPGTELLRTPEGSFFVVGQERGVRDDLGTDRLAVVFVPFEAPPEAPAERTGYLLVFRDVNGNVLGKFTLGELGL